MLPRLLLLCFLALVGHVFAEEPPGVDCLVVNLEYVRCSWNKQGTPEVNYTFSSKFSNEQEMSECPTYLSENGTYTGCNRPYGKIINRFRPFHTKLVHGNKSSVQEHGLRKKVKLNPPTNVTVQNDSNSYLSMYWNKTNPANCVDNEVRVRINNREWRYYKTGEEEQTYRINLPSNSSRYEMQVRSRIGKNCGESDFWSDWSEPAVWGSNNSTVDPHQTNGSMSVWIPVLCVVGALTLVLMVMTLLHHERIRIILIPVVPKPSPIPHDIEDWIKLPKGLKESFKANYSEQACPVQEYCPVSQSDSESFGSSASSVTTDQTDCSVSIRVDKPDLPTSCSSSSSATLISSEAEEQVSV